MTMSGRVATPTHQPRSSRQFSVHEAVHVPAVCVSVLVYATVLQLAYRYQVSPYFAEQGLTYRTPDIARYALALVLVGAVAVALPRRCRRASDFLQWMPFVIAGAPSILLAQYMDAVSPAEATRLALAVFASLMLCRALTVGGLSLGQLRPRPSRHVWAAMAVVVGLVYLNTLLLAGVPDLLISGDVYAVRAEFGLAIEGSLVARLLPSVYNVVNPVLMARGLFARKFMPFAVGAGGQLLIFMWEGQKSVLLSVPAVVGTYLLLRRRTVWGYQMMLLASFLTVGSLLLDWLSNSYSFTTLFIRRFLVIPGALTVAYVMVFKPREKTHFSELGLGNNNPYEALDPAFIVGREFVRDATTHANVNIWGHGYLSFGYLGMLIVAIMYAVVLLALDASSDGLPPAVVGVVCVGMAIVISSANIFTSILTHGIWSLILVLFLLPRTGWGPGPDGQTGPGTQVVSERDQ
ncbi:hypothetical protein [Nocardioides sp.]|uniref:hypothetical protein n=1 Tax=Nocardioides sp. TaxID=35761 RepID=UPI002C596963|nr:hypothetical protein [Nocardioides sp.]HXH80912.1 hypothetical protein [Nocardioides sp.]